MALILDLHKSCRENTEFPYTSHPVSVVPSVIMSHYHSTLSKLKTSIGTKLKRQVFIKHLYAIKLHKDIRGLKKTKNKIRQSQI